MTAVTETKPSLKHKRLRLGPGLLVTAAFIGPGTVVTASKAGAAQGCGLLWAIVFSCIGTIVLQSLAARLGILSGKGLGESIRQTLSGSVWLKPAVVLIIAAIGIGNAAYQTGNLTGAAAGMAAITGLPAVGWVAMLAVATAIALSIGRFAWLQTILVGLVVLLSLTFLSTAALAMPSLPRILSGVATPRLSVDNLSLVLGLIGTTIVPYNLFLHASSAATTWRTTETNRALRLSFWDTLLSISLGGLVTAAILLTASAAFFDTGLPLVATSQIADQLAPTLGRYSGVAFSLGLFAAGLTSAITAPLATAYAICGCLGWQTHPSRAAFRCTALAVVGVGAVLAIFLGGSPTATILFAQVANGLLLPVVAIFLLWVVRHEDRGHASRASSLAWVTAWLVVIPICVLGLWRVWSVFST